MKIIFLDMADGLAGAFKILLIMSIALIPISAGCYFFLIHKKKSYIFSFITSILVTYILATIFLFIESQLYGAEPYESIFNPILLSTSCIFSSPSILILLIIFIYKLIRK